jgi:uncharacterized Zn finger protein (UPF0148 family)
MFEKMLKAAKLLEEPVSIPVEVDAKGYLDRECPNEACEFHFKVNLQDWGKLADPDLVTCPMCGHKDSPSKWLTTQQVEELRARAKARILGVLDQAMRDDARSFNDSQPKNGLIKLSLSVSGSARSIPDITLPIQAAEAMELEITCDQCTTRFAVVGSAFFCPVCGHSSAERMFDDALRKMEVKMSSIEVVRQAIEASSGKDAAAVTARSMLETCLPDGVAAFQKFCEALYAKVSNAPAASFNAFQRLKDGSSLWKAAVGHGYEDWLSASDLDRLNVLFQRRHLLAHAEGIVDAKYLTNTNDATYRQGQRIVVVEQDVRDLSRMLSLLGNAMRGAVSALLGTP